jgi:hypothetical protein
VRRLKTKRLEIVICLANKIKKLHTVGVQLFNFKIIILILNGGEKLVLHPNRHYHLHQLDQWVLDLVLASQQFLWVE